MSADEKLLTEKRTISVPSLAPPLFTNVSSSSDGEISLLPHRPSISQTWLNRLLGAKATISEETPEDDKPEQDYSKSNMARSRSAKLHSGPMLEQLLKSNRRWAKRMTDANPKFFTTLSKQQSPKIFWIGCSDSRVPANQIVDLAPVVHRNVANIFHNTDFNALSVLQYAVDVLKVEVIIVCGHYGCGGVLASIQNKQFGLIDNWLRHLKDIYSTHRQKLDDLRCCEDGESKVSDMLCELNVAASLNNICHTTIVQNAWDRGQKLSIHGWAYRLSDGKIRDLDLCISNLEEVEPKIFRLIDHKLAPET